MLSCNTYILISAGTFVHWIVTKPPTLLTIFGCQGDVVIKKLPKLHDHMSKSVIWNIRIGMIPL